MSIKGHLLDLADEMDRCGNEDHQRGNPDVARAYWHAAAKIRALKEGDK